MGVFLINTTTPFFVLVSGNNESPPICPETLSEADLELSPSPLYGIPPPARHSRTYGRPVDIYRS